MIPFPCPNKVDCEGSDYPIANLSIEGLDRPIYVCTWTHFEMPLLGGDQDPCFPICTASGESYVNNELACLTAHNAARACAICGDLFENDEITITVTCP